MFRKSNFESSKINDSSLLNSGHRQCDDGSRNVPNLVESTEEPGVFHNKITNETVITYRGTSSLKDIKPDTHMLFGTEMNTERYSRSEEVYKETVEKYGLPNLTVVGHSVGGNLALNIGGKYDVQSVSFTTGVPRACLASVAQHLLPM